MAKLHSAFADAGKSEGLEVWRIEDMEPVPVPRQQHGSFYSGDSYIVLKTTEARGLVWDIHFWLGAATSADEAGAAAILTVNLDDERFQGAAVQHRETQGYESKQFLSYFRPAIRYLDGGHASGFHHVTINAGAEKRLFQIKGRHHVRVKQVEAHVSSMNKGDCFLLDVGHTVYVYMGERAQPTERLKATELANHIRDQDHAGRAEVEIVDPYSSESDVSHFFAALGSGDSDAVADAAAGGDDEEFERGEAREVSLNEVSDDSGQLKVSRLPPPLHKDQLNTKECCILDAGTNGIFVWVGRQSNEKEKVEAMKRAEQYLAAHHLPAWVHVSRVPEGVEPAVFRQHFEDWP